MNYRFTLLFLCVFLACQKSKVSKEVIPAPDFSDKKVKNIILLIGDGMALSQASGSIYWNDGLSVFGRFQTVGFHKQQSYDDLITDSAAGATAFACGCKTTNGAIGVLPNKKPCRTILEDLSAQKLATGMVVTCSAAHATPACFIAHQEIRAFTDEIANDYLKTNLDCYIGGGEGYFNDRYDKIDLIDTLEKRGYDIFSSQNVKKIPTDGQKPFYFFTADREPGTASAGRKYLPEASAKAAQFLKNRNQNGFFLMVEGSQIDWALHANDERWLRAELLDFQETLKNALDFAATDGNTLVLVTGDHECGGVSLLSEGSKGVRAEFGTKLHTAALVPVYAFGPKAEIFNGIYENTDLYFKMWEALGQPKERKKEEFKKRQKKDGRE